MEQMWGIKPKGKPKFKPLDPENPDWESYAERLWKPGLPDRFGGVHYSERDRISKKDWASIRSLVESRNLPVTMCNTSFGFTVGLNIWKPPDYPTMPCEGLLTLSTKHMPGCPKSGPTFTFGWNLFRPLVARPENLEMIELLPHL